MANISAKQSGVVLLEALIAILIFSFGLLGLIGTQATAIGMSIDAKSRSDAAYLGNQLISMMWLSRGAAGATIANLDAYSHNPAGCTTFCDPSCSPTVAASSNSNVTNWLTQVNQTLPGSSNAKQQVQITTVGSTRQIQICLRWKTPQVNTWHSHSMATQLN